MAQTIRLSTRSTFLTIRLHGVEPATPSERIDFKGIVGFIKESRAYDSVYGIPKKKLWALRGDLDYRPWGKKIRRMLELGLLHLSETGAYKLGPARAGLGENRLLIKKVSEKTKANAELKEGSPSAVGAPRPSSEFEQPKKYDVKRHQTAGLAAPSVAQNKQVQAARPPVMPPEKIYANTGSAKTYKPPESFNKLPRKPTIVAGLQPGPSESSKHMATDPKKAAPTPPIHSVHGSLRARQWGEWVDRFHPPRKTHLEKRFRLITGLMNIEATPEELAYVETLLNETHYNPAGFAVDRILRKREQDTYGTAPPLPAFGHNGQGNGRRVTHSPQPLATRAQSPKVPDDDGGCRLSPDEIKKNITEILARLASSSSFEASEPSESSPASDTHRHRRRRL